MFKNKFKIVFILCFTAIIVRQGVGFAQTYNDSDKETLRVFLRVASGVRLNIDYLWNSGGVDTSSWYTTETWVPRITGITWNNDVPKRIQKIDWRNKNISGPLNLSNAAKLTSVDCSKNTLTSLNLSNNLALTSFNCSENGIRTLLIPNTPTLTDLDFRMNWLRFSTMPTYKSQYSYFFYYPQSVGIIDDMYSRDTLKVLRNEYKVSNGVTTYTTTFEWYEYGSSTPITSLVQNINGLFKFDPSLEGKTLTCKMYNGAFGPTVTSFLEVRIKILGFTYNESDKEALRIFLRGESADGLGNINKLWTCGVTIDTLVWYNNELWVPCISGITWDNVKPKHITRINWDNKTLGDSLNLNGCDSIIYFSCKNNAISGLNTSTNYKLAELYCNNNQLKYLDLSKNTKLTKLNCAYNKLRFSTMTPKALHHTSYIAMPQDTINGGTGFISDLIDLSSEYVFKNQYGNDATTQYIWTQILDDGTEITINNSDIVNNNGVFTFSHTLTSGNYLCRMTNFAFDSIIPLVFKIQLIEVNGFFVNENQVEEEDLYALLDCGVNTANVRVSVNASEYPLVKIEGMASLTYSFAPNYGKNYIHIDITDKNGITKTHILIVEKRLEASIFKTRWDDRLVVPLNVSGIICSKVEWYKHTPEKDIKLDRDASKGYIQITENGSYFVVINDSYRSCFIDFEIAPSIIGAKAIPNPVRANNTFTVVTGLNEEEMQNAKLQIINAAGVVLSTFDVNATTMELLAPPQPGNYSISLITHDSLKIIKIIVIK